MDDRDIYIQVRSGIISDQWLNIFINIMNSRMTLEEFHKSHVGCIKFHHEITLAVVSLTYPDSLFGVLGQKLCKFQKLTNESLC